MNPKRLSGGLLGACAVVILAGSADPARCSAQGHWTDDAISPPGCSADAVADGEYGGGPCEEGGADLPAEAQGIVKEFDLASQEVQRRSEEKLDGLREAAARQLKTIQDKYTRDAKLDEAVAVRGQIRRIFRIQPYLGGLGAQQADIGKRLYFEVVGATVGVGAVWGSDVYTTDSHLAAAAVHAGALKPGEKGVVRVIILPGLAEYKPSDRNGVSTLPYGSWTTSFRVEKPSP